MQFFLRTPPARKVFLEFLLEHLQFPAPTSDQITNESHQLAKNANAERKRLIITLLPSKILLDFTTVESL